MSHIDIISDLQAKLKITNGKYQHFKSFVNHRPEFTAAGINRSKTSEFDDIRVDEYVKPDGTPGYVIIVSRTNLGKKEEKRINVGPDSYTDTGGAFIEIEA